MNILTDDEVKWYLKHGYTIVNYPDGSRWYMNKWAKLSLGITYESYNARRKVVIVEMSEDKSMVWVEYV